MDINEKIINALQIENDLDKAILILKKDLMHKTGVDVLCRDYTLKRNEAEGLGICLSSKVSNLLSLYKELNKL